MKSFFYKNYKRITLFFFDCFAYYSIFILASVWLNGKDITMGLFVQGAVFSLVAAIMRVVCRIYSQIYRYSGTYDILKIFLSDFCGFVICFCLKLFVPYFRYVSGMIILLTSLACLAVMLFVRFAYRLLVTYIKHKKNGGKAVEKKYAAIFGAGEAGYMLISEMLQNPACQYIPYCLFDDDISKVGRTINGIKVKGTGYDAVKILKKTDVKTVIVAIASISDERRSSFVKSLTDAGYTVKIYDYSFGDIDEKLKIKDVNIEDLLFRKSIKLSPDVNRIIGGKRVMVTGGGGSIGSEICRQVASGKPEKLIIVDIYENNAYDIQNELIRKYGKDLDLEVIISSVRDREKIDFLFDKYRPEVVFHAAAHKHVPLMEEACDEAIKNNVFGTLNVADAAEKYGVSKMVLISTDKAVNPTNVMGASKRLCEMIIQSRKDSKTDFIAVRFGNVLGSNGSVIPLFKKQLENGGPLTITDKRIIRYFMTIPEATSLVLETAALAEKSEIFVLDMGKPVHIIDLAENMIKLSGLRPYKDIDIKEIGLRPGEKLYEELLVDYTKCKKTENEKIFIEQIDPVTREEVAAKLEILKNAANSADIDAVKQAVKDTVPTYCVENANAKEIKML
ncbi:MAG: polysaccharide biosynthesis protein [Clostridia bacterium]|nr:polysaccharide biosynthesis protein [Clostridia bacterium]